MNPTKIRGLKAWGWYVGGSALLLGMGGLAAAPWLSAATRPGLWLGLGLAFVIQALAFGALLFAAVRRPRMILAGWAVGTFLRLLTLLVFGLLLVGKPGPFAGEAMFLALGAGLLALMWLEPLAYRWRPEAA